MICPHCSTAVRFEWYTTRPFKVNEDNLIGYEIKYAICPNCNDVIIYFQKGLVEFENGSGHYIEDIEWQIMIHPKESSILNSESIPKLYLGDYEEAIKVISGSPKASAALSRRLLQTILREQYKIKAKSLSHEIEIFVQLPGIPSHLTDAVDAIRQIGNLAAHPTKDNSTGEIVPVEVGEAEWLIEVIEALFDFTFIQPIKLQKRKEELNEKLDRVGKSPMK